MQLPLRQLRSVAFEIRDLGSHESLHRLTGADRATVDALRRDPSVAYLVADERIELTAQTYPTGILRVNARKSSVAKIDAVGGMVRATSVILCALPCGEVTTPT